MKQEWFEMMDVRRRRYDSAVWIPLRASEKLEESGRFGHVGYRGEFFGAGSIAVAIGEKSNAEELGWSEVGLMRGHCGSVEKGDYIPADVFRSHKAKLNAVAFVLAQDGNEDDPAEWHLHPDLVVTLMLKREGDIWLAMNEGYIEVARLKRKDSGSPVLLEIRAEHLKDYLCARGMALYLSSYRRREEVSDDASHIRWALDEIRETSDGDRWEGRKVEICEGGDLFGSSAAYIFVGRKDVDTQVDVPTIGPSDTNIFTETRTKMFGGKKLVRVLGEFWRNEWVDPGVNSPRVRGDRLPSTVFFVTDAGGKRVCADELQGTGGWLWFRPEVIQAVYRRRGGGLRWYTRFTGGVKGSPGGYLHFGVNSLGMVNVYAKDISHLSEWKQKIWAGFNVGPEGGVSEELLAAQAEGQPADTPAPEMFLPRMFEELNRVTETVFGFHLFRQHKDFGDLVRSAHRFRATDEAGLLSLAKDLARLTADSIDATAVQKVVKPPKAEKKWGSLKSLENLVAINVGAEVAHRLLGPLFGIYELRNADAHLPSSSLDAYFELAGVDRTKPLVQQGFLMLHACVSALDSIRKALNPRSPETG